MTSPDFYLHTDTPVARAFAQMVERLSTLWDLQNQGQDVHMYVSGGMAMHLYTGTRIPTDVDVEFMERVVVPSAAQVTCTTEHGQSLDLRIDATHHHAQCLLHEWHRHDAIAISHLQGRLSVYVLSPVDVATSKLLRWNDRDQQDVFELMQLNLISLQDLEQRANGAAKHFQAGKHLVLEQIDRALADVHTWACAQPQSPSLSLKTKP